MTHKSYRRPEDLSALTPLERGAAERAKENRAPLIVTAAPIIVGPCPLCRSRPAREGGYLCPGCLLDLEKRAAHEVARVKSLRERYARQVSAQVKCGACGKPKHVQAPLLEEGIDGTADYLFSTLRGAPSSGFCECDHPELKVWFHREAIPPPR